MSTYRLLVTKKISPSLVLQAGLKGVEVLEKEFIIISPLVNDQMNKKISKLLSEKKNVAFTSKNAVSAVALNRNVSDADWRIFCLEGATINAVRKYFPGKQIAGTAGNAASLGETIVKSSDEKQVVFFCGNKRLADMPDILQTNGFDVEEIVVYKTEVVPQKIIDDFNGIAFFSPSAVKSFFSENKLNKNVTCFTVGNTTTEALKKFTENKILTSDKPSEESMLDMVIRFGNKH